MRYTDLFFEAKKVFESGGNVIEHFKGRKFPDDVSLQDIILFSYDLQAGSYTAQLKNHDQAILKEKCGRHLADVLGGLSVKSVCEAGIGEATTLRFIADRTNGRIAYSGFDISLSRLLYGRRFLQRANHNVRLFAADLLRIPLPDNAMDVVLTNHSIEPNGGHEAPILRELARVAKRYVILVEPDYESASAEQKARMRQHNYVQNLRGRLAELPGRVIRDEPWPYFVNPLNKASLLIFAKDGAKEGHMSETADYVSPLSKQPLIAASGCYFCPAEGLAYPIVMDIPLLHERAAVIASHTGDFVQPAFMARS